MDLIRTDLKKCVNCHRCISVCPVKFCLNASSGSKVEVNNDLCIYCGKCIEACTHGARFYSDDLSRFTSVHHTDIIFLVDPAIIVAWGENYKKIIFFLKTYLKAHKVFDLSFGAELTLLKLLEYIKIHKPACVISQQCPTIVKYIETYQPELIEYLSPVDSPAMALARYLREVEKYKGEIACLTPCIAKTYEFSDPNTGLYIDYNITFKKISQIIKRRRIDLSQFPDQNFDHIKPYRGINIGRVCGLKEEIEHLRPFEIKCLTGQLAYEEYFTELNQNLKNDKPVPLVIDVLNCNKGCSFGTATLNEMHQDEADHLIYIQQHRQQRKYPGRMGHEKFFNKIQHKIKHLQFERNYTKKSPNFSIDDFTDFDLEPQYQAMNKVLPIDFRNCSFCGYNSCRYMALAMQLGFNIKDNCHYYFVNKFEKNIIANTDFGRKIATFILELIDALNTLRMDFAEISNSVSLTHDALLNVQRSNDAITKLSKNFRPIVESITGISDQTHLLSLNASIEAARAGKYGKGFTIVAQQVDALSSQTSEEVEKITPMVRELLNKIRETNDRGDMVLKDLNSMTDVISEFFKTLQKITEIIEKLSAESKKINEALIN